MNASCHLFRQFAAVASAGLLLAPSASAQLDKLLTPIAGQTPVFTPGGGPQIAAATAVARTPHTLGADAFVAELEKELHARLAVAGDLKLTLAGAWQPLKLPGATFGLIVTELPVGGISGTFVVRVKIQCAETLIAEIQVPLRAQLWQEVWVAATRLERGQALDRVQLGAQKVDVLRERVPLISVETDPTTLEIAQSMPAGHPLTRRDVVERPVVRKGQVVEAVAQAGLLAISMKALALESGAVGDLIKLRNLESRKEFSGQILNENKVTVRF